jgi:hypothetical protein
MPDPPRDRPGRKRRDTSGAARPTHLDTGGGGAPPPPASATRPQAGKAWTRPRKEPPPAAAPTTPQTTRLHADPPGLARLRSRAPEASSFRMQLGDAAEDEVKAHREAEARLRLRRLRPWFSALFLAASLSLVAFVVNLVLALAGASKTALAISIVALVSGAGLTWGIGLLCTFRVRDWRWLAIVATLPPIMALAVLLVPLPPALVYPLLPLAGLVYALSKRDELFAPA